MKVLIDECIPRKFKFDLSAHGHECSTVQEAGFAGKRNGELIGLADGKFNVLLTVDRNVRYQQSLAGRRISILIVRAKSNRLADLRLRLPDCLTAMHLIESGEVVEI